MLVFFMHNQRLAILHHGLLIGVIEALCRSVNGCEESNAVRFVNSGKYCNCYDHISLSAVQRHMSAYDFLVML